MTVSHGKPAIALRYALALACVGAAVLLSVSPVGSVFHPSGPFILAVVAAAWFGGAGPGVLAAFLSALSLPQLIGIPGSLSTDYPLLGGFFDLPRFITLGLAGAAVGWGTSSYRRAEAALRERERLLSGARDELETAVIERTGRLAASEEALRAREERYSLAMDASAEGHFDFDLDTDELFISERMNQIYGFPPGTRFDRRNDYLKHFRFYGNDAETYHAAVRAAEAKGGPERYEFEYRILRPSGEIRWLRTRGKVTRDAEGFARRRTGVVADITEAKLGEEALRASEERYALAVAGSDDGVWDVDFAAGRVFVSARARELAGLPPGPEMVPMDEYFATLPIHPEDVQRRGEAMDAHLAGDAPAYEVELRLRQQDGTYRWRRLHGLCIRDASGLPQRMAGSIGDIDSRRRAEDARRASEERYALAMEAAGDGHTDWNLVTGEFYISPRLLKILSYPPDTTFADRADWVRRFPFHPDDRKRWEAAVAAHFAGREAKFKMDLRIVVNGEIRWVAFTFVATRDAAGNVLRWTGSIADINDAKRDVATMLDAIPGMVAILSTAAEVDAVNNELMAYLGQPLEVIKQWGTNGIVLPEDVPRAAAILMQATSTGQPYELEVRIRRFDGVYRWNQTRGLPFRDSSGGIVRWYAMVSDIDERKRAEEALRESEKRYERVMLAAEAGFWDWDVAADEFYVSPKLLEMTGFPPGTEFTGRADFMARAPFHPDDRITWERSVKELFASGGTRLTGELRTIHGAETRWYVLSGLCIRDPVGKVQRWTGSATYITEEKRAKEALRLSEERYALAMEASEEAHFDWNVQSDEIFASERLKQVLDLPADAEYRTRGDMVADTRYYPGDRERLMEKTRDVLAGRALHNEFEYRILRGQQQELRWIRARWKIFRNVDGVAQRVVGVVSDITERKQAVDTLRESESRFRTLVELSSNGFWVQDENLRYTSSPLTSDVAGYDKNEQDGKTRWELSGDPTPLSTTWAEHQADLAARRPFRDFEYRRVRADGKVGYYSASGAPIFDEDGRFRGYYGVASDITERKRVEEELRSRQEMLELAQKSARAVAFEWKIGEREGQNRWSPDLEAMYGFAPGTYDGTFETWKKCVHPEDWATVTDALRHAHGTGEVASEYRVVHPDGSVHWLQARGRMLFDAVGNATRMVGFMQDITQRKHAEEELRKMEQELRRAQRLEAIGTLAGGIAHDFNNILGAILGYGEMAMRDAKKGTRLHRDLDSVMAAGERGRALVDRILAFSRSGVGERVPVHVEAVVREALDQVAAGLPANVTVMPRLRAGRAAMLGDSTQVHQVVMNLASNAVQAMPQGGVLRVALETARCDAARPATVGSLVPGDYIVLTVSDTGTGIPDDVLERMFDPFFTTKEVGVGTGLGLSLVHGIVTSVGGAIGVATERGKGTTFTVHLRRSGDATEGPADESPPLPRGEGQRVLIVDDEEPLVRLATETLEELGYVALGFTSSAAALEAIRADPQRFDALITDERMPGMTGSALIRQVRGIRDGIPIVLMTGFVGGGALDRARDAGADEVLKKPLSARELATSLARVLRF